LDLTGTPESVRPVISGHDPMPEDASSPDVRPHRLETEAAQMVNDLLKQALDAHATSIHIEQDVKGPIVRCRINGRLEPLKRLHPETAGAVMARLKTMAGLDKTERRIPQQGAFTVRIDNGERTKRLDCDVRVATWSTAWGEDATLRIFDAKPSDPHLDRLHYSGHLLNRLKEMLNNAEGILLFSGRPGSGRRTSLYASASYLLRPDIKMLAVEDAIRFRRSGIVQVQIDNGLRLGPDTLLRMAPDHDPDVILVTSIQNPETAEAAFDIASGGPFILGAMVAEDAVDALLKIRAFGVGADRIAQSLKGILAQRRVRSICRDCREHYVPDSDEWRKLFDDYPGRLSFYRGAGCKTCGFTGYDGFIIISELLTVDDALTAAVHKGAEASALRQLAVRSGFKTMAEDALGKLNRTTIQELLESGSHLFNPTETPETLKTTRPDASEFSTDGGAQTWFIGSLEKDAGAVDDMYETYRGLREQAGHRPISVEAGLFHEFIAASFHHICRHYGCSRVRFWIETNRGRAEIAASPERTVQQDR
jgi:type IV pilus assembly protein PilB